MHVTSGESRRRALVQFLILLIIFCLALMMIVSWSNGPSNLIHGLVILSMLACVIALTQERRLKKKHESVLREVAGDQDQDPSLGNERRAEKVEFMKLEERLRDLTKLYRAIGAVNAVSDHSQAFAVVLRAALDLVGGDCGSLMMVDTEEDRLTINSAVGLDKAILSRPGPKLGDGIAGWVALNGDPVLINGPIGEDEGFKGIEARETALDVAISLPLQLDEVVIGVLNLGSTTDGDKQAFSDDDLRFAYIFAQHAAMAIARARLAEERERLRVMIGG